MSWGKKRRTACNGACKPPPPPTSLPRLPRQELNASHNKVTGIPASISGLHKLAILRLDHNLLASLPQALGGLWRSLQELDLGENDLSQLPSSLGACRKLETLVLSAPPCIPPPPLPAITTRQTCYIVLFPPGKREWLFSSGNPQYSSTRIAQNLRFDRAKQGILCLSDPRTRVNTTCIRTLECNNSKDQSGELGGLSHCAHFP